MLKKSFILAAALAAASAPVLAASGAVVKVPTTTEEITARTPIVLMNKGTKSGPETPYEYAPVSGATLTVEACNYDRQVVKIEGEIFADKKPNEVLINNFSSTMQATYARGIIQYATSDLTPVNFGNQVSGIKTEGGVVPPNNYKEMNRFFNAVTRATESSTGIKMIFMPRLATIGPVNPDCPLPAPKR